MQDPLGMGIDAPEVKLGYETLQPAAGVAVGAGNSADEGRGCVIGITGSSKPVAGRFPSSHLSHS